MNKKVLAIILSLVMVLSLVPTAFVFADSTSTATLTVKADKTVANPGDVIEFSVELEHTGKINTLEATISIPAGLTLVEGSLETINRSELGWDDFGANEAALLFSGYGSASYEGTAPVVVATFKCTVDADSVGNYEVTLIDVFADDENYETKNPEVVGAAVEVVVAVTGVTLNNTALALDSGANNTATLVATIAPDNANDKAVTWVSSNPAVATVNNGVITAVKYGTATITVTTVDGGYTATCVVTVTCAHTNVTNVPVDEANCMHPGHGAYTKCNDCGVIVSGSDETAYGDHAYGTLIGATSEIHTPSTLAPAVDAHYFCSVCNTYFTESKVATTLEALTGVTPSHSYGDFVDTDADQHWKECGCGAKIEVAAHEYDNACDTDCNTCGYVRVITHDYSAEFITDGENHWKECSVCGDKTEEGAHIGGVATCQDHKVCDVCGVAYGELGECDFVENADEAYIVSEATCVDKAVYYKSCSICGARSSETFEAGEVDADNHIGGTHIENASEATCTVDGYTGDTHCDSCGAKLADGDVIPAEHSLTEVPATEATHDADGNIKYFSCAECQCTFADENAEEEIDIADTVIAKGEHAYGDYVSDNENHWKECECGGKTDEGAHEFGEWVVTKEATEEESGSRERTCYICGYVATEEIPVIEDVPTGDNNALVLYGVLLVISALTIAIATKKRRAR